VTGPVQVLVVGFEEASVSGDVVAELTRLTEAGVVRLIDVLLVRRTDDGELDTMSPPGGDPGRGRVAAALLGVGGGTAAAADADSEVQAGQDTAADRVWSIDESVPHSGVAAIALVEHLWAQPLVAALRGAGAQPLDETWLAPQDVALLDRLVSEGEAVLDS
jgi:hypothetical protein